MKKPDLAEKQTVLIVDDDQQSIDFLKRLLKSEYRIRSATTAGKAFRATSPKSPPDLVLMNPDMPGLDGAEFCRKLRTTPETWNIPVLSLLADESGEDAESRCFRMGAADCLKKPYNPLTVSARVRTHAEIKKYRECLKVSYYLDGLTGLPNNRRFEEYYESVWYFSVRESMPLSVIRISIADFDVLIDRYGQNTMDECIKTVGEKLSRMAKRKTDMLARTGREEFTCVLPNTRMDGAIFLAETFRAGVYSLKIPDLANDQSGNIVISQGVATTIPSTDMVPEKLLKAAEETLKKSASEGRGQINCKSI